MYNVCPQCSKYDVKKDVTASDHQPQQAIITCSHCGMQIVVPYLPLFILTGASGSGKSTIHQELMSRMRTVVWLSADIFWIPEFNTPEDDYHRYHDFILRAAKNILFSSQKPVVIESSMVPRQIEDQPERRYFSDVHFLALTCTDEALEQRLKARPEWRQSGNPDFIFRMKQFQQWLRSNAAQTVPPMTLLDTTSQTRQETGNHVKDWILAKIPGE